MHEIWKMYIKDVRESFVFPLFFNYMHDIYGMFYVTLLYLPYHSQVISRLFELSRLRLYYHP